MINQLRQDFRLDIYAPSGITPAQYISLERFLTEYKNWYEDVYVTAHTIEYDVEKIAALVDDVLGVNFEGHLVTPLRQLRRLKKRIKDKRADAVFYLATDGRLVHREFMFTLKNRDPNLAYSVFERGIISNKVRVW